MVTLERADLLEIFERHPKEAAHLYRQIEGEVERKEAFHEMRTRLLAASMRRGGSPHAALLIQRAWGRYATKMHEAVNPFYELVRPHFPRVASPHAHGHKR